MFGATAEKTKQYETEDQIKLYTKQQIRNDELSQTLGLMNKFKETIRMKMKRCDKAEECYQLRFSSATSIQA